MWAKNSCFAAGIKVCSSGSNRHLYTTWKMMDDKDLSEVCERGG